MTNKIMVIGPCCSGKSFLSRELSEILHIPVYHLDKLFWKPGWVETPKKEFKQIILDVMENDSWIIDGTYCSNIEDRFEKATTVIFLDFDVEECVKAEKSRRGQKRDDLPDYLVEEYDPEFINFIRNFPVKQRPIIMEYISAHPEKEIIILKNRKEKEAFVNSLK